MPFNEHNRRNVTHDRANPDVSSPLCNTSSKSNFDPLLLLSPSFPLRERKFADNFPDIIRFGLNNPSSRAARPEFVRAICPRARGRFARATGVKCNFIAPLASSVIYRVPRSLVPERTNKTPSIDATGARRCN